MKKFLLLLFPLCLFAASPSFGQYKKPAAGDGDKDFNYEVTELRTTPKFGTIRLDDIPEQQFAPSLMRGEIEQETGDPDEPRNFKVFPQVIQDLGSSARYKTETTTDTPTVFNTYIGSYQPQYTPPDNSIATGKSGYIVSAINCTYRIYDSTGKSVVQSSFYDAFHTKFPALTNAYFDPRVI